MPARAQQVQVTTPLTSVTDSFYENIGVNWGFQRSGPNGGFSFNFGSPNSTAPAFGGFNPNNQANFGFATRGRNGSAFFNLSAGQGNTRSITSAAPTLMLQNGVPGSVQDVSLRPFVTSFIPVVGDRSTAPTFTSPLKAKLDRLRQQASAESPTARKSDRELLLRASENQSKSSKTPSRQPARRVDESSAAHGDISVAEIRRRQQSEPQDDVSAEIQQLIQTARVAEASGYRGAARLRYRKAAALATGELKQELLSRLEALAGK